MLSPNTPLALFFTVGDVNPVGAGTSTFLLLLRIDTLSADDHKIPLEADASCFVNGGIVVAFILEPCITDRSRQSNDCFEKRTIAGVAPLPVPSIADPVGNAT